MSIWHCHGRGLEQLRQQKQLQLSCLSDNKINTHFIFSTHAERARTREVDHKAGSEKYEDGQAGREHVKGKREKGKGKGEYAKHVGRRRQSRKEARKRRTI